MAAKGYCQSRLDEENTLYRIRTVKRKCNYRPEVFTCTKIVREMKNRKVRLGMHTIKYLFFLEAKVDL